MSGKSFNNIRKAIIAQRTAHENLSNYVGEHTTAINDVVDMVGTRSAGLRMLIDAQCVAHENLSNYVDDINIAVDDALRRIDEQRVIVRKPVDKPANIIVPAILARHAGNIDELRAMDARLNRAVATVLARHGGDIDELRAAYALLDERTREPIDADCDLIKTIRAEHAALRAGYERTNARTFALLNMYGECIGELADNRLEDRRVNFERDVAMAREQTQLVEWRTALLQRELDETRAGVRELRGQMRAMFVLVFVLVLVFGCVLVF